MSASHVAASPAPLVPPAPASPSPKAASTRDEAAPVSAPSGVPSDDVASAVAETVTILTAKVRQAKTHRPGKSVAYGNAKHVTGVEVPVDGIKALSEVLTQLEQQPHRAVIRGALKADVAWSEHQRRLLYPDVDEKTKEVTPPTLEERPRRWLCIDLDRLACPEHLDPADDPEDAVRWVLEQLPEWLRGVTCHWQWSSSAGIGEAGWAVLKLHLWFWLLVPLEDRALRSWARLSNTLVIDPALYSPAQLHYTAAPIFEGLEDPLAGRRSGLYRGWKGDAAEPPDELVRWRELEEARRQEAQRLQRERPWERSSSETSEDELLRIWAEAGAEAIRLKLLASEVGSRHDTVRSVCGSLANSITWGVVTEAEALDLLGYSPLRLEPGRGERELEEILEWAMKRARANPQPRPVLGRGRGGGAGGTRDASARGTGGGRGAALLNPKGPSGALPQEPSDAPPTPPSNGSGDDWDGDDARPEVVLLGDLHLKTLQLFKLAGEVQAEAPSLFARGREVVRLVRDESRGALLEVVHHEELRAWFLKRARFLEHLPNKLGEPPVPSNLKDQLLKNALSQADLPLPPCERVIHAPVFDARGAFVAEEGYHPRLRAVLDLRGFEATAPQPEVSREELLAAVRLLTKEWLGDFPFGSESSAVHALLLALTPLVRPLIEGPVPLFLVSATAPGTGKTLLVDCLAHVTTGEETLLIPEADNDDEWRKKITTALLAQPTYALLDNVNHALDSGSLASVLTRSRWDDRRLGGNETISVSNETTWIVTANHPKLSHELVRRVVWIDLDAKTDAPDERSSETFRHSHLPRWTREHRAKLLHALCVIIQCWVDAGMPRSRAFTLGSFDAWAEVMGGICEVAGLGKFFLANRADLKERANPEAAEWRAFFEVWWKEHSTQPQRASDLAQLADDNGLLEMRRTGRDASLKSQKFGYALRELRDAGRVIARWRIAPGGAKNGSNLYRLEEVEP